MTSRFFRIALVLGLLSVAASASGLVMTVMLGYYLAGGALIALALSWFTLGGRRPVACLAH